MCLFHVSVRISNKETPCSNEATDQFKVTSSNSSLRLLRLCINMYLISVPRYRFLILDTHHPETLYIYLSESDRIRRYFWKPKTVREQKKYGKYCNCGVQVGVMVKALSYNRKVAGSIPDCH